jgi:hypothetical protein
MTLLKDLGWRYGMALLEELMRLENLVGMLVVQRLMGGMERKRGIRSRMKTQGWKK